MRVEGARWGRAGGAWGRTVEREHDFELGGETHLRRVPLAPQHERAHLWVVVVAEPAPQAVCASKKQDAANEQREQHTDGLAGGGAGLAVLQRGVEVVALVLAHLAPGPRQRLRPTVVRARSEVPCVVHVAVVLVFVVVMPVLLDHLAARARRARDAALLRAQPDVGRPQR